MLGFFLAGFFLINQNVREHNLIDIKEVKIAGVSIKVDLAVSLVEHAQGLSGRDTLKEDEGMLFIFDQPAKYSFWMKEMNFPIDIIWFTPSKGGARDDMHVVYIKKNALPESYPESYVSDQDAKYVLEVVAGFSGKNNLQVGDRVYFTY